MIVGLHLKHFDPKSLPIGSKDFDAFLSSLYRRPPVIPTKC